MSGDVAQRAGVKESVGKYHKDLLPSTDELKAVHQKSTFVRTLFYQNTLPWGLDGAQMLPTANYMDFMSLFREQKTEWERLVSAFLRRYDLLVRKAEVELGPLFNSKDYPSRDELANKFAIDMAVMPVPRGDFRVDISSEALAEIQQDVEARVADAGQKAMDEAWRRLYTVVDNMAEKLSDPSSIFRDTLVENARDICDLLPSFNIADDHNMAMARDNVMHKLTTHTPEALRRDFDLRADVAQDAKDLRTHIAGLMGGIG